MKNTEINAARIVENAKRHWGRFVKTPIVNYLDEFKDIRRVFENFRTKEWAGFAIIHPDFYSAMILQDAKYVKSSEIHVYDLATRKLNNHSRTGGGPGFRLTDDLLHSSIHFKTKGYYIGYTFTDAAVKIDIDIVATAAAKSFKGELILDATRQSNPLVVSTQLSSTGRMYTNKIIYPAAGYLKVGDRCYDFDPQRDLLILDEHKSRLPYQTRWTWGTFALPVDGSIIGANFAARPQLSGQEEESCIWTPGRVEALSDIHFDKASDSDHSTWHIYSADGRLDVLFTPEGQKKVRHNFGIAGINYLQLYGTYKGILRGEEKTWNFEGIHGLCETMHMRA